METSHFTKQGPFLSENALVQLFARSDQFRSFISQKNHFCPPLLEFDCADGIADIVIFSVRDNWSSHRDLALIPPSWAYALRALPYRKQFSENNFAEWCGVTKRTAREVLRSYEKYDFVKQARISGSWTKIRQPRPLVNSICAIEAKLRDWKKALFQAIRYKSFANQSWVLLDSAFVKPAIQNMDMFASRNIGLASMDQEGTLEVYLTPVPKHPRSEMYYWQANAMIGASLCSEDYRPL